MKDPVYEGPKRKTPTRSVDPNPVDHMKRGTTAGRTVGERTARVKSLRDPERGKGRIEVKKGNEALLEQSQIKASRMGNLKKDSITPGVRSVKKYKGNDSGVDPNESTDAARRRSSITEIEHSWRLPGGRNNPTAFAQPEVHASNAAQAEMTQHHSSFVAEASKAKPNRGAMEAHRGNYFAALGNARIPSGIGQVCSTPGCKQDPGVMKGSNGSRPAENCGESGSSCNIPVPDVKRSR